MTSQQKRRFTLALNAFCRARSVDRKWDGRHEKFKRRYEKSTEKLYHVADTLKGMTDEQEKAATALILTVGTFIAHMQDKPVADGLGWKATYRLTDTGHFHDLRKLFHELKALYKK